MKKWLRAQPPQPATIAELQTLLDAFVDDYNHRRPHRSLPHRATPAAAYTDRPKATPSGDRTTDTHDRVRRDKINKAGAVTLRVTTADCTTSASAEPTPEPTSSCSSKTSTSASSTPPPANSSANSPSTPRRDYQPTGRPPGPTPEMTTAEPTKT